MVYCDYVEESVVSQPMNGESEPYRHSKNRGSRSPKLWARDHTYNMFKTLSHVK